MTVHPVRSHISVLSAAKEAGVAVFEVDVGEVVEGVEDDKDVLAVLDRRAESAEAVLEA